MPANMPVLSDLIMYGPVATRYLEPYVVGDLLVERRRERLGTGADSGRLQRADDQNRAAGFVEMEDDRGLVRRLDARDRTALVLGAVAAIGAGEAEPKYAGKYGLATFGLAPRSIA